MHKYRREPLWMRLTAINLRVRIWKLLHYRWSSRMQLCYNLSNSFPDARVICTTMEVKKRCLSVYHEHHLHPRFSRYLNFIQQKNAWKMHVENLLATLNDITNTATMWHHMKEKTLIYHLSIDWLATTATIYINSMPCVQCSAALPQCVRCRCRS